MSTARTLAGVWLTMALMLADPASAQYFGGNKVQYEDFDFRVLRTDHFDIHYYPREREAVEQAARLAERWRARLSTLLDHELSGRQPLILYSSDPDFQQTTAIPGTISEGTGGVTERLQRRVVLPFTGSLDETDHVLGHELVHAFQFDMGGEGTMALPLWFIEGMAEYLSLGPVDAQTAIWLRDAAMHEELPGFEDLSDPQYFPYRYGHAAWAYLAGRWGDDIVRRMFLRASQHGDPLLALEQETGVPQAVLSEQWHAAIRRTYADIDLNGLRASGEPLITQERSGGEMNVGPALSPDGTRIAFLSERSRFSIELYVADAATGENVRKLTETATSAHLDSIQFLESSGAWSPDGRRIAVGAIDQGQAALRILDVESGDTVREITFDDFGELLNPAWGPDGQQIVFTGLDGGFSDLYLLNLASGAFERLTEDAYADLQPSWAPDGQTVVFATDRFTTDLAALDAGHYRLARMDVGSGNIRPLPAFDDASHLNPQFAPDGEAVYFVGTPNGIPNVYRVSLATGSIEPVTNLTTGVTGITRTTPALSVARTAGSLAYTAYADGKYAIYSVERPQNTQAQIAQVNGAVLPPATQRTPSDVAALLARPAAGLPRTTTNWQVDDYDADIDLVYAGAATALSTGGDAFGARLGGGISFLFSDTLGTHLIGLTAEASGDIRDIGAQLSYLNQDSRWHWGAAVERLPFRSGFARRFIGQVGDQPALVEQVEIVRQINHEVSLVTQYPFNRSTRIELSGGARFLTFDRELEAQAFSLQTGRLIAEGSQDLDAPGSITLGQATAAFVYDTSVFGATGPVLGARSRLQVTPMFGGLRFSEVVGDYRQYVSPVRPFTIAGRLLHVGRYGGDAGSTRLNPLFIGYPTLVRGYDVGSFDAAECVADATSECPAFDRLTGTRMLVATSSSDFPSSDSLPVSSTTARSRSRACSSETPAWRGPMTWSRSSWAAIASSREARGRGSA